MESRAYKGLRFARLSAGGLSGLTLRRCGRARPGGRHACDGLLAKMKLEHGQALPEILNIRDSDPARAKAKLESLLSQLNLKIQQGKEVVLEGLREADLKALNNLYVDVKEKLKISRRRQGR
jgi:hypothetical protein